MGAETTTLTEHVLKRDRVIVVGGLVAMALLSWAYILTGAGMGMSVREMTIASLFPHRLADMPMPSMSMETHPGTWSPGRSIIVVLMWWTMMIAMMTPSVAPVMLLHARVTRRAQATGQVQQGLVPTAAFAYGYLLLWLGFSLVATALHWFLQRAGLISEMMGSSSARASAAILLLAGLYQLSPMKNVCLRHCRAPAEFISRHWRPNSSGALRMGLEHGAFCVGCCWMLMLLLFVGGTMNVIWIAALAVLVLLEKVARRGVWISRLTGIALLAWSAATLVV